MKMHPLSGGRLRMRKSIYFPDADRSETMEFPVSCALLRHSQGNVLFDTGCHPSVPDEPEPRWRVLEQIVWPITAGQHKLVTRVGDFGMKAKEIDTQITW